MRQAGAAVRWINRTVLHAADAVAGSSHPLRRRLSPLHSGLLQLLTLGRGYPADINGTVFRIDPRFRWAAWHAHERAAAEYLAARIRPGQCCFDVGASIGVYARSNSPTGRRPTATSSRSSPTRRHSTSCGGASA